VTFSGFTNSPIFSNLRSGTVTPPKFGSIVVKALGEIFTSLFVKTLKRVDFPTFGKPTIPTEKDMIDFIP
jgi:hypothetical protein